VCFFRTTRVFALDRNCRAKFAVRFWVGKNPQQNGFLALYLFYLMGILANMLGVDGI